MRDRFVSLLDFRTENKLSKDDVSVLLEKNGFKIIDMTEMDGLTYFYSQNISEQIGLSA